MKGVRGFSRREKGLSMTRKKVGERERDNSESLLSSTKGEAHSTPEESAINENGKEKNQPKHLL